MLRALILPVLMLATPVAAATTIQQDFDAAQALLDAGRVSEAQNAFTTLLSRFSPTSRGKAASLVRARLGNVMRLMGDPEAAEPLLAAAFGGLTGAAPQDSNERASALLDLALTQENLINFDAAAKSYRSLLVEPGFIDVFANEYTVRAGLVRTLIWSDPDEARRQADLLLAVPKEKFGKTSEPRALLESLRGRIELNAGNPAEAKRWFTAAAKSAGGADTSKINIADIRIRGDLALVNFHLGNMAEVQHFAAMSGAGQLLSEGLSRASQMPLPACAPLTGLAPDAMAVVEFGIAADGRTIGVTPVFANSGSGAATAEPDEGPEILFARAVRNWSWAPERLAKLDSFWRQSIRVELRCFSSGNGRNAAADSFRRDNEDWASAQQFEPLPALTGRAPADLPVIRADIKRREAKYGDQSAQLLLAVAALSNNPAAPLAESEAASARYRDLLRVNNAPASIIILARMTEIQRQSAKGAMRQSDMSRRQRDGFAALLAEQVAAGTDQSRIGMFSRLQLAQLHDELKAVSASRALLDAIVATPETLLPASDPVRIAALLRISNQAAAARDTAAAATALTATGLSPEQCALVDVRPQPINKTITDKAFPALAIDWRTGGFARIGYDITADGGTTNVRTIAASPPFVFGPGTVKAVGRFRYQPVLRPGNMIGCSGSEHMQYFRVSG